MDFQKLCTEAHNIAQSKGWLDKPRSWAGTTALMHSEISEALEEYRAHRGLNETYYEVTSVDADGTKTMFVHGAEEWLARNPPVEGATAKPCGIPSEVADLIIRICQHCGTEGWDLADAVTSIELEEGDVPADFETLAAELHSCVSDAYGQENDDDEKLFALAATVLLTEEFCKRSGIELEKAVAEKMAYNSIRSYRHGNKKI